MLQWAHMIDIAKTVVQKLLHDNSLPWELARLFFIIYPCICALLFFAQRWMMYFPTKGDYTLTAGEQQISEQVTVTTSDGLRVTGLFVPPASDDKPIVLLAHGNAGNAQSRLFKAEVFKRQRGWGTLIIGYRSYGPNPGKATEDGLIADARAHLDWLRAKRPNAPLIYYGESLGTGVAVALATEHSPPAPAALVLEAAYSSTLDVAKQTYFWLPLRVLMLDQYRSDLRIAGLTAPLVMFHGKRDRDIPHRLGEHLFGLAPVENKRFVSITNAGHNDLYASERAVTALLAAIDDVLATTPAPMPDTGGAEPEAE